MDKAEFKKLVKECLTKNVFTWQPKGKCYIRNFGEFILKVDISKSPYGLRHYVECAVFINTLNDEKEVSYSIGGDIAPVRISYVCPETQRRYDGYDLETYSTEEIVHMLSTAVDTDVQMYEQYGIRGLFKRYPWSKNVIYLKNREYILARYDN